MVFLLQHFWAWLLGALLVGVATGFLTRDREPDGGLSPWLSILFGGLLVGVLAAVLQALPERAGVWLETALPMIAAFLVGGAVGALIRGGALRDHRLWSIGLIPLGILWLGANLIGMPGLEAKLSKAVAETVRPEAPFELHGRDVALGKDVPNHDALVSAIDNVPGVRLVEDFVDAAAGKAETSAEKLAESTEKAAEKVAASAEKAAESAQKTVESAAGEAVKEGKTVVDKVAEEVSPPADRAAAAKEKLAALPETGDLDASLCESALNATVTLEKIQFGSNRADIARGSMPLLGRLAALLKRCPGTKAEVGGYTDNTGSEAANRKLSQRRANAVVAVLRRAGVPGRRLSATGHGSADPIAANETEDGRAENRRIEFRLK